MRKRWSSSHIYCDWKVAGAETRGASVAHTCCHSSADSTDCHGAADGPVTSLPPRESSFSISNPWDKFGLTFTKEAPVSPVGLPDHQGWKERELMHVPVCLLGFRSHMWISAFVLSHFTLFFSFLTSLHTSISSIGCKINGLTEAIVTNFHNCVWSNLFNKFCVCTSMFAHMHTRATSGWFQSTWHRKIW